MKICAAQTMPLTGDIPANIARHRTLIEQAVAAGAELIVFPELSLTGYEPSLARELAVDPGDPRFDDLQAASDAGRIAIGAGVPTRHQDGIRISMLLFQPHQARSVYSKSHLHADEEPFFVPGRSVPHLMVRGTSIALAICYEISVPGHLESALRLHPSVYVASVAKSVNGIEKALERLSRIAEGGSLPVLMANCVGFADGSRCGGRSSAWNRHGSLVGQLGETDEGLLTLDTGSEGLSEG